MLFFAKEITSREENRREVFYWLQFLPKKISYREEKRMKSPRLDAFSPYSFTVQLPRIFRKSLKHRC